MASNSASRRPTAVDFLSSDSEDPNNNSGRERESDTTEQTPEAENADPTLAPDDDVEVLAQSDASQSEQPGMLPDHYYYFHLIDSIEFKRELHFSKFQMLF